MSSPDRPGVADITDGDSRRIRLISKSEVVITNQMMDSNSDCRVRLAVILDVVILVGFFAVIGLMAAKVR